MEGPVDLVFGRSSSVAQQLAQQLAVSRGLFAVTRGLSTRFGRLSKNVHLGVDFDITSYLAQYLAATQNIAQDDPVPAFYWNEMRTHTDWDNFKLGDCAKKVLRDINAGGNSIISEALSAEILVREFGASGIRTEMEVEYSFSNWKICDYTIRMQGNCDLQGKNVGVSVTRAFNYQDDSKFTYSDAETILNKKINGLILARSGISEKDAFYTSILHVWVKTNRTKNLLHRAYKKLPTELKDNVIILCTVADIDVVFKNARKTNQSSSV